MRWYEGSMQPIGGWVQRTAGAVTGKPRAMIAYADNDSLRWIIIGTHSKLYALTQTGDTPVDITPVGFTAGNADASSGAGYGIGPYGADAYGTTRVDSAAIQEAGMWTLDTFGEVTYGIMAADSNLYKWTPPDTGVKAVAVSGAPQGSAVVVTPERFIFVLGADGDNRTVRWADQESDSDWTPGATDQAGSLNIESFGKLMCGKRLRGGTLLWTDQDAHLATYIGLPFVYSIERIGENCGVISRGAAIVADTRAMWMGNRRFYAFDGVLRELSCEVHDGVFGDFNYSQQSKVTAHHEPQFSECWWFYPCAASTENDRAVVYNYAENTWAMHEISRLSATPRGVFNNPIMADASGYLWDHEVGYLYSGDTPYAESAPYEIGEGDQIMRVKRLIADEKTGGDVSVTFKVSDWPNMSELSYGPYTLSNPVSVRFAARKARLRIDGVAATGWRWGAPRVEVLTGGRRG